jgi:hypothetical protein
MRRLWRTWRTLTPDGRQVALECALLIPIFVLLLRHIRLATTLHYLSHTLPPRARPQSPTTPPELVAQITDAVAARLPLPVTCLHRATTTWWLLRRRGIPAVVQIGVRRADGRFDAHAWVEVEDRPLAQRADIATQFTPIAQGSHLGARLTIS